MTTTNELLHRASQKSDALFEEGANGHAVTARQITVLKAVAANEGLSQTHIVEATGIDRATASDIVRRLHRKGLIARRRTREDARAYAVKVTPEGQRILSELDATARHADASLLRPLPPADRRKFVSMLERLVAGER